jgi:hypothetical protein
VLQQFIISIYSFSGCPAHFRTPRESHQLWPFRHSNEVKNHWKQQRLQKMFFRLIFAFQSGIVRVMSECVLLKGYEVLSFSLYLKSSPILNL